MNIDPDYRYYNCNIQCPKLKTQEFQADSAQITNWLPSGIFNENGVSNFGTVHDIAPSVLTQSNCTGELTLYLKNDVANITHTIMVIVTKNAGIIIGANPYQTVGTFTTYDITAPNNNTIRLTCSPGGNCSWIWRGI